MTQRNEEFTPIATMPQSWWVSIAYIHDCVQKRQSVTVAKLSALTGIQRGSMQGALRCLERANVIERDSNSSGSIYGLTDFGYELLSEYAHNVTDNQSAEIFYSSRFDMIGRSQHRVAA